MTNDLENQSSDLLEDFLPYVFTEDAVDEAEALASVGQEDSDSISPN